MRLGTNLFAAAHGAVLLATTTARTHEMGFAHEVADTVVFLDGSVIVKQGAPADVLGNPREARTQKLLEKML